MAKFTRAEIRKIIGESCTDEIENQLVALHLGVVDPLKDDVTRYKADAEKLPGVQKELDDLKAQGDGGYKAKYEAEHKAFVDYKANVDAEKTTAAKEKALSDVLLKIGISENGFPLSHALQRETACLTNWNWMTRALSKTQLRLKRASRPIMASTSPRAAQKAQTRLLPLPTMAARP